MELDFALSTESPDERCQRFFDLAKSEAQGDATQIAQAVIVAAQADLAFPKVDLHGWIWCLSNLGVGVGAIVCDDLDDPGQAVMAAIEAMKRQSPIQVTSEGLKVIQMLFIYAGHAEKTQEGHLHLRLKAGQPFRFSDDLFTSNLPKGVVAHTLVVLDSCFGNTPTPATGAHPAQPPMGDPRLFSGFSCGEFDRRLFQQSLTSLQQSNDLKTLFKNPSLQRLANEVSKTSDAFSLSSLLCHHIVSTFKNRLSGARVQPATELLSNLSRRQNLFPTIHPTGPGQLLFFKCWDDGNNDEPGNGGAAAVPSKVALAGTDIFNLGSVKVHFEVYLTPVVLNPNQNAYPPILFQVRASLGRAVSFVDLITAVQTKFRAEFKAAIRISEMNVIDPRTGESVGVWPHSAPPNFPSHIRQFKVPMLYTLAPNATDNRPIEIRLTVGDLDAYEHRLVGRTLAFSSLLPARIFKFGCPLRIDVSSCRITLLPRHEYVNRWTESSFRAEFADHIRLALPQAARTLSCFFTILPPLSFAQADLPLTVNPQDIDKLMEPPRDPAIGSVAPTGPLWQITEPCGLAIDTSEPNSTRLFVLSRSGQVDLLVLAHGRISNPWVVCLFTEPGAKCLVFNPLTHTLYTAGRNRITAWKEGSGPTRAYSNPRFQAVAMCLDPSNGDIWVADHDSLRRFRPGLGFIQTVEYKPQGEIRGLVCAGDFLVSTELDQIRRIDSTTFDSSNLAGGEPGGPNGELLRSPAGLALDSSGRLYVADRGNHLVRRIEGLSIAGIGIRMQRFWEARPDPVALVLDERINMLFIADSVLNGVSVSQNNDLMGVYPITLGLGAAEEICVVEIQPTGQKLNVKSSRQAVFLEDLRRQLGISLAEACSFQFDADYSGNRSPLSELPDPIPPKLALIRSTLTQSQNSSPVLLEEIVHSRLTRSIYDPLEEFPLSHAQAAARKAVIASPTDLTALATFASTIPRHQLLVYPSHRRYEADKAESGIQLLGRLLQQHPKLAIAYRLLAKALFNDTEKTPGDCPPAVRGRTRLELLQEAHRLDPADSIATAELAIVTKGQAGIELALAAAVSELPSHGFYALGVLCPRGATLALPDGRSFTAQAFFVEAIQCDPTHASAYLRLGASLRTDGQITLSDGRTMTQHQLYLEALKLEPFLAKGYYSLASTPNWTGRKVVTVNGREFTRKALYLEAIKLDPTYPEAYNALGPLLDTNEALTSADGRRFTKQDLYIEAISLNPSSPSAHLNLARTLYPIRISLKDGRAMTKKELYLEAIKLYPTSAEAYFEAGLSLTGVDQLSLPDGRTLTKQALYIEAIKLDPTMSQAYEFLSAVLPSGGKATLADGRTLTADELYKEARVHQTR